MESNEEFINTDNKYRLIRDEHIQIDEDDSKLCEFSEEHIREGNKLNKYINHVIKPLIIFILLNPFMSLINSAKPFNNISESNKNLYTRYLIVMLCMMLILINMTIPESNWRNMLTIIDIFYIILNVISYTGIKFNKGKFLNNLINRNIK
jgi:hypothetical protein